MLGQAFRQWRNEKGWSQREAAGEVNAAPSTWNDWETGDVRPHPSKLRKIAEVFGKPHDEILRLYAQAAEEPASKPPVMTAEARMGRLESAIKDLTETVAAALGELAALREEVRQLLSAATSGEGAQEPPQNEAAEAPGAGDRSRPSARPTRSRRSSSAQ